MGGNLQTEGLTHDTCIWVPLDVIRFLASQLSSKQAWTQKVSDYKTTSGTPMEVWYKTKMSSNTAHLNRHLLSLGIEE